MHVHYIYKFREVNIYIHRNINKKMKNIGWPETTHSVSIQTHVFRKRLRTTDRMAIFKKYSNSLGILLCIPACKTLISDVKEGKMILYLQHDQGKNFEATLDKREIMFQT